MISFSGGCSLVVKCDIANVETGGSIPLTRSTLLKKYGLVAEELGRGLQNPAQQCKSAPDLRY